MTEGKQRRIIYSEDEDYPQNGTTGSSHQAQEATTRTSSTSSLSEADAEGEPDDLDADADGIEDDDGVEYEDVEDGNYEPMDGVTVNQRDHASSEDEDEDDSAVEMDLDENASSPPPSPPHTNDTESGKKPLVLKLKLATHPAGPPTRPTKQRKKIAPRKIPTISKSNTSNRSRSSQRVASTKRPPTDEEDDELAEDSMGLNSEMDEERGGTNVSGLYQASEDTDGASTGDETAPGVGQLTVRQRAKECGEPVMELQSLPMTDAKKKKELTEADRAMEKAEKSRKRKHQNEKKLEDEKTETINRLLKGQIGKAGRGGSGTKNGGGGGGAIETTEESSNNQQIKATRPPPPPTLIRTISSIKSGEYTTTLNLPSSLLNHFSHPPGNHLHPQNSHSLVYPPHVRPPPKSWKLVNGVRVN